MPTRARLSTRRQRHEYTESLSIRSINHALDRHLGGHSFDQWGLAGIALLAVAALIIHLRTGPQHQTSKQA